MEIRGSRERAILCERIYTESVGESVKLLEPGRMICRNEKPRLGGGAALLIKLKKGCMDRLLKGQKKYQSSVGRSNA